MKLRIVPFLIFVVLGCSQQNVSLKPQLTTEILQKELVNFEDFDGFSRSQLEFFNTALSLDQNERSKLLEIRPNLSLPVNSTEFQSTLNEIHRITKFRDCTSQIRNFRIFLSNRYVFEPSFFEREFAVVVVSTIRKNSNQGFARTSDFISWELLAFISNLVKCDNGCFELASNREFATEEAKKNWQAGCFSGCLIYDNIIKQD